MPAYDSSKSQRPKPHRLEWQTYTNAMAEEQELDDRGFIAELLGCPREQVLTIDSEADVDGFKALESWVRLRYMVRSQNEKESCYTTYGLPNPYDMKMVKWDDGGVCAYFIRTRDRHKLPEQHGGSALPAVSG